MKRKGEKPSVADNDDSSFDWEWFTKRLVKLQPIVAIDGKTVDWWSAGFVSVTRSGQNVVRTSAEGQTPQEALRRLREGKYYVKDDHRLYEPGKRS